MQCKGAFRASRPCQAMPARRMAGDNALVQGTLSAASRQQKQQQQRRWLDPGARAAAALAALVVQVSLPGDATADQLGYALLQQQQVVEVQQVCRLQSPPPLADLAGLFGLPDDSVDPFTLYGTNFKKYQIERLQGEKVLSRQRGFTVDSCVSAITASEETPEFNGLSTGDKVQAANGLLCKRSVGPDLKQACKQSCATACTDALAAYEDRMFAETGYKLQPKERERVLRNCRHSCSYECTKSGKAHDFAVPYRK
eukprot:GHRR01022223.1.p1 GENE.GHRR01022223.1~~GHRR01022223.1.p1  ORF type:complete len:255 (+),score=79.57 GHRR01022223.1:154-918(+)